MPVAISTIFRRKTIYDFGIIFGKTCPSGGLRSLQYALPVLNKTGFDEFKRNLILGYTCVRPPDLLVHFCTSYRASDLRHKKFFYSMYQNALILVPQIFKSV